MNDSGLIGTHELKTFPRNRRFIIDTLEQGARRHRVYGLVELDVTRGRQVLGERQGQRGERLSFTAWIVKCIAQAVSEHKYVNAYRHGRSNVVVFDDVDVVVAVERFVDGKSINYPLIVRKANDKTVGEITDEIRGAKSEKLSTGTVVVGSGGSGVITKMASRAPKFVRQLFWWRLSRDAFLVKRTMGTVMLTSVGMFGRSSAFIITPSVHTLAFGLGGISQKPRLAGQTIEARDYLSVTVSFDHDLVDGAPAARFVARVAELIETAYGLN